MTTKKTVTFSLAALLGVLFPAMVAEAASIGGRVPSF